MEKLLLLLEALEKRFNELITQSIQYPQKWFNFQKLLFPITWIMQKILIIIDAIKQFISESINSFVSFFKNLQKKINYYLQLSGRFLSILKEHGLGKSYHFLKGELTTRFFSMIRWLEQLGPKKFFFLSVALMFVVLNVFHLVSNSKKFVNSLPFMQPPEIEAPKTQVPDYYNFREKKIRMNEVKFPLFMNGPRRMKHLNLDLTVEFSNRTAQMFFVNNRIIFLDHLQMSLEPMDPQFSLTDEGKNIQRQKIKREIDHVLKTREIAGEVKSVHIEYLLVN